MTDASALPPADRDPDPARRWSLAASALGWSIRVGLIGGVAFGLAQSVVLGWPHRGIMGLRQWGDVLTHSSLAHGALWAAHGMVLGVVCGVASVLSGRVRRGLRPGALGLAVLAAGTTTLLLWSGAAVSGVSMAKGLHRAWGAVMSVYWLLVAVVAYLIVGSLSKTWMGRLARRLGRIALWPAVSVVLVSGVVQWFERPRLLPQTTGWRQASAAPSQRKDGKCNVVLVVLDTQRVDRLGCYGYPRSTTPRLDAFARDALVFEDCTSAAIWTLPSHASMFTGLFPSEHGAHYDHTSLDNEFATMAELLQGAGYETVAFSNNVWISAISNLSQGFDRVIRPASLHLPRGNSISEFLDRVLYPSGRVGAWLGAVTSEDVGAKFTNQLIARWLDRRDKGRPFFLFVNYLEPHHPYRPHRAHRAEFLEPDRLAQSYRYDWIKGAEFSLLKQDCYSPDELRLLSDTYDAETRMLDDYVGELLEVLSERTALDETFVIITADHGENLGDHRMLGHSWCVYETLAHVPLIMRYPKRLRPGRTAEPVQTVDLLPTVMDAAHGATVRTPSTFGRSLLTPPGEVRGPSTTTSAMATASSSVTMPAGRITVIERMAPRRVGLDRAQRVDVRFDRTPFEGVLRAIRQGSWKYIVAGNGREELYHLADDPGETRNLIEQHRGVARVLADRLAEWLALRRCYAGPGRLEGEQRLDEETRRRLRALGYL